MKKIISILSVLALVAMLFAGCGANGTNDMEIVVGASSTPHAEILEVVKEAKNGLVLSDIPDDEWPLVKKALQFKIFANIKDVNTNNVFGNN